MVFSSSGLASLADETGGSGRMTVFLNIKLST
jgi:hypothetical protein